MYVDQEIPVGNGTYKIVRVWTILDGCVGASSSNPFYYTQVINVVDEAGPALNCPVNFTFSVYSFG